MILTMTYSFSKHGKHLRTSITASKSGKENSRAKIFTLLIVLLKVAGVKLWRKQWTYKNIMHVTMLHDRINSKRLLLLLP
jgi:hypothetical protein